MQACEGTAGRPLSAVRRQAGWRDLADMPHHVEDQFLVLLRWEDVYGVRFGWDVAWLTPKRVIDGPWKYADDGHALAEVVGWMPGPDV